MKTLELIPNKSVYDFLLGHNINKYLDREYEYYPKEDNEFSDDLYEFLSPSLLIWTDDNHKIAIIGCYKECYWEDRNLIKMPFNEFQSLYNVVPDKSENIYLLVNGRGQNQTVYDFDKLGLQIWVWRKKIVTVLVSNYQDCED